MGGNRYSTYYKAGTYEGTVIIKPEKLEEQNIKVILEIENELLADRGDSETWRPPDSVGSIRD